MLYFTFTEGIISVIDRVTDRQMEIPKKNLNKVRQTNKQKDTKMEIPREIPRWKIIFFTKIVSYRLFGFTAS